MVNKLGIILPVFNNINTLDNTLQSIIDQTDRNFDLYVIDDNSTDGSSDILKSFCTKYNFFYKKIFTNLNSKYYNNINIDAGGTARNEAYKVCENQYIFSMGDEILFKNTVEIIKIFLKKYKYYHYIFDVINIPEEKQDELKNKRFNVEKYLKENKIKILDTKELIKFSENQIGILYKFLPSLSNQLPFKIKNSFFLKKLFYKNFQPVPGCSGCAIYHKNVYKKIFYNNLSARTFPAFNGRGTDRDMCLRVIRNFKKSVQISLPIFPSVMDHPKDFFLINNYLY
jgi:glycosyltransferase involved in cell wall biosynthesis